jgi:hypothetical protein
VDGTPSVQLVARWGGTGKDLSNSIVLDDATLLSAEISRGSAVLVGSNGVVFATGETTAPPRSLNQSLGLLQPTMGAFRQGQRLGSTDAYLVALR